MSARRRRRPKRRRSRSADPSELALAEFYALRLLEAHEEPRQELERDFLLGRAKGLESLGQRVCELRQEFAQQLRPQDDEGGLTDLDRAHEEARLRILNSSLDHRGSRDGVWERALEEQLEAVELRLDAGLDGPLYRNAELLGQALGLTPLEQRTFIFVALVENQPFLNELVTCVVRHASFENMVETLFGDDDEATSLFDESSALVESGLVVPPGMTVTDMVRLAPTLAARLLVEHETATDLIDSLLHKAPAPTLALDDFEHIGRDGMLLRAFVDGALTSDARGLNIMIHGEPGTGKTQLVRSLARALDVHLFEVPVEEKKRPRPELDGMERLASLRLAQRLVGKVGRCAMLFDEAEDLFPVASPHARFRPRPPKGFVNSALETTPTLTFWTSNAHGQIDPAHLRRFDLVLELDVPPQSTRRRIIEQKLRDHGLSEASLDALSRETLPPAEIERLARVLSLSDGLEPEAALEAALSMGANGAVKLRTSEGAPTYDASLCATSDDLEAVAQGLVHSGQGRLLLYGVPGTGKTAWVRHLAQRLDKPLIEVGGSSLLSMWVGGTEQNMAKAFRQAARQGAVLFIDEADTFLRSRGGAQHSYEVSSTNELLMQMERFDGLFVCATNMLDTLDPASLRRFDLKLEFRPLLAAARERLFHSTLELLGLAAADATTLRSLHALDGLTPGDYASVARRGRFLGAARDAAWLVDALAEELSLRDHQAGRRAVGFGR